MTRGKELEMNKKLLIMKGFPNNVIDIDCTDYPLANRANFDRMINSVYIDNSTVYLYKDQGCVIDGLIKLGEPITSFRAVDYAEFFAHTFAEGTFTVKAKVLYIYNVGTELSNSTDYSDKVLHKLIQHNKAAGNTTIIVSDYYNSTTFLTKYSMTSQLLDNKMQVVR
jgi:hypothetical protein